MADGYGATLPSQYPNHCDNRQMSADPADARSTMRLWSLHPSLLDARGLVAVWREGLLAQKVLRGKTQGYRHHPQLERFRRSRKPIAAIVNYLWIVHAEAVRRGYLFNRSKIVGRRRACRITVTRGQLAFEWAHLMKKVRIREPAWLPKLGKHRRIKPHPLFVVVAGKIEPWERARANTELQISPGG